MKPTVLVVWPLMNNMLYTLDALCGILGKKGGYLPLSPATGAAYIPRDYDVRIIDENVEGTRWLQEPLNNVDLVVLSFMNVQYGRAEEIARQVQSQGVPVACAGAWVSHDEDCRLFLADFYLRGPAEGWAEDFFGDFRNGRADREYSAPAEARFSRYEPPRFDLLRMQDYHNAAVQTAEGCTFRCTFCPEYHRVLCRPIEQVLDELETLYGLGARSVVFVDANLWMGQERYVELMEALASWNRDHGWGMRFGGEVSLNLADKPDLLKLLPEAGFQVVYLGVETLTKEGLLAIQKGQNVSRNGLSLLDMVRRYQRAGLEVMAGFVTGFDHDDLGCFEATVGFIEQAGIMFTTAGPLVAVPGAPLWEQYKARDRLVLDCRGETGADGLGSGVNFGGGPNFVPAQMTRLQLAQGADWMGRRLASVSSFQKRLVTLVQNIGAGNHRVSRCVFLSPALQMVCLRAHLVFCRDPALRPAWWTALKPLARYPRKIGVITRAMCEFFQLRASAMASGADVDNVPAEPVFS